jgi:hypothetical protein
MKTIHLLPTDKPSRLRYNLSNVLVFTNELYRDYGKKDNHHIYITSDEEVKEGDYFLYNGTKIRYKSNGTEYHGRDLCHISGNHRYPVSESKKIILTTDQDLIKNGVQSIDDEFLEWFVKNSSCESVKVEKYHGVKTSIVEVNANSGDGSLNWGGTRDLRDNRIIIPKEEPKDVVLGYKTSLEAQMLDKLETKQETLEEASWKYNPLKKLDGEFIRAAFIDGAKWQTERMYTYDELRQIAYNAYCKGQLDEPTEGKFNLWIQQFKKK